MYVVTPVPDYMVDAMKLNGAAWSAYMVAGMSAPEIPALTTLIKLLQKGQGT